MIGQGRSKQKGETHFKRPSWVMLKMLLLGWERHPKQSVVNKHNKVITKQTYSRDLLGGRKPGW